MNKLSALFQDLLDGNLQSNNNHIQTEIKI